MSKAKPPAGRWGRGAISFISGIVGIVFTILFLVAVVIEGQGLWSSNGYVVIFLYSIALAIHLVTLILAIRAIKSSTEGKGFAIGAIALISVPLAVLLVLLASFVRYSIKANLL